MKLLPSADFISVNHFADSTWRPMPNRIWLLANRSRADNVLMQANVRLFFQSIHVHLAR